MKGPAARPPSGRRRALAGPTLVCGRADRPRWSRTGRPARGINARAFRADFHHPQNSGPCRKGGSRGVRHRDPGFRTDATATRHPVPPRRRASAAFGFCFTFRPGDPPPRAVADSPVTQDKNRRDRKSGADRIRVGPVLSCASVESCRFRTPPRSGCRSDFASRYRDLVGGACGSGAPGYARHPVSNATGPALHATEET